MKKSDFEQFRWLNESQAAFEDDKLTIHAPEKSDFFRNNGAISSEGITPDSLNNAPFYYTEVAGDRVYSEFSSEQRTVRNIRRGE